MITDTNNRPYIYAAVFSLCFHISVIGAMEKGGMFADLVKVRQQEKFVPLELVDEKNKQEAKEKPQSNLIDEIDRESRDKTVGETKGLLPKLEGKGKIKTTEESIPLTQPKPVSPQDQPQQEYDGKVKEIRDKIKELAELEKELDDMEKRTEREKVKPEESPVVLAQEVQRQQRLLKNLVSEAREAGEVSLATQQNVLAPYLKRMREKIFSKWYPFISLKFADMNSSKTVIEYKVLPDGNLEGVRVLHHDGSDFFRDFCETAVKNAAPFDPLPIELPSYLRNKYLTITFTFYYD